MILACVNTNVDTKFVGFHRTYSDGMMQLNIIISIELCGIFGRLWTPSDGVFIYRCRTS